MKDGDINFVFIQWDGKCIHPITPSKWFTKFIKENNLSYLTFHGLRHTKASLLIGSNVNVTTVVGRLRHTKPTTTTTYSHILFCGGVNSRLEFKIILA